MRRVIVFNSLTLDGVMQGPGRADEDVRGGFTHGGWALPYADEVMGRAAADSGATTGAILLGRRTYEDFYSVWPTRKDNPYTEVLNNTLKYVASNTLTDPLPWMNSKLLQGDAVEAVGKLKKEPGKDMVVLGSGVLVESLTRSDLVDEYILLIHPLVLGSGRRMFNEGHATPLRLVDSKTTTKGVVIATYRPAGR
ncbi:MAG TPA: dihydrofolate reductase family protein [Candidatus Acidoferrum sp.]|nr:dihydrofolate reductase family protein [Candidatus Acidoferrum sp.]